MSENIFAKIATFSYSAEALILKGKIESEGIEVFLFDNNTVDTDPILSNAIGGVKLFVYTENFEKASFILKIFNENNPDYQNENVFTNNRSENITDLKSLFSYIKFSFTNLFNF